MGFYFFQISISEKIAVGFYFFQISISEKIPIWVFIFFRDLRKVGFWAFSPLITLILPQNFSGAPSARIFLQFPLGIPRNFFLVLKVHFLLVFPCKITRFSKIFALRAKINGGFYFSEISISEKIGGGFYFSGKSLEKIAGGFYLRGGLFSIARYSDPDSGSQD